MKGQTSVHFPQLDGLRTLAIGMVLIAHWAQWRFKGSLLMSFQYVHGVTLFFVISGFLITGILIDGRKSCEELKLKQNALLKAFYARRFLRIFPIYYLLIGFLFLVNFENTRSLFPWLVTYTSNIYQSIHCTYVGDFNHFWSLAAEEQFYLFWPIVLLYIPRKRVLTAILSMIFISIAFRIFAHVSWKNWMAVTYSTPGCMYALGIGALGAYLKRNNNSISAFLSSKMTMTISIICYLILFLSFDNWGPAWYKVMVDEIVFAYMSLTIVMRATTSGIGGWAGKLLESRPLVRTGQISYGIYLFHLFVPTLVHFIISRTRLSIKDGPSLILVFLLITWCLAALSWKFIEEPLNRLKRYFPYTGNGKRAEGT